MTQEELNELNRVSYDIERKRIDFEGLLKLKHNLVCDKEERGKDNITISFNTNYEDCKMNVPIDLLMDFAESMSNKVLADLKELESKLEHAKL